VASPFRPARAPSRSAGRLAEGGVGEAPLLPPCVRSLPKAIALSLSVG
jgi:hypothetical protein